MRKVPLKHISRITTTRQHCACKKQHPLAVYWNNLCNIIFSKSTLHHQPLNHKLRYLGSPKSRHIPIGSFPCRPMSPQSLATQTHIVPFWTPEPPWNLYTHHFRVEIDVQGEDLGKRSNRRCSREDEYLFGGASERMDWENKVRGFFPKERQDRGWDFFLTEKSGKQSCI